MSACSTQGAEPDGQGGKRVAKRKLKRPAVNGYAFIQKDAEWLESPAYRALRPLARCLLDEFLIIYRESRNGDLTLSTRAAAQRLGVSENTVLPAFDQLVEHGFLEMTRGEVWVERKAREWRLTIMPSQGQEPTDDWRRWAPGNPVRLTRRSRKSQIANYEATCLKNSGKSASETEAEPSSPPAAKQSA